MEKKNWNFGLMLLVCSFLLCVNVEAKKSLITSTKYDIEGVEIGEQGTYLVKVFIYT